MKFVQTLLESYNKLNEAAGGDVIGAISSAAGNLGKGDGSRNTITPPNGGSAGQVGLNDNGEAFLEGGPLAGFSKANVITADQKTITTLQNWWAGEGSEDVNQEQVETNPDLAKLNQDSKDRLEKLEEVIPGITDNLLTILKNSRILEEKGLFKGRAGVSLLQKVLGIPSRGSLAYLIEQEFQKGTGAFRVDGESFIGFSLDKDLKLEGLKASFDTMVEFSNAFAKSFNCDELDHDTKEGISNHVTRDPKTNSFFFKNMFDPEGIGVSLSVADQNPINMMAEAYSDNLKKCNEDNDESEEANAIPEKDIYTASYTDNGNISNTVKDVSEMGAVAFFDIWKGDTKKGTDVVKFLLAKYGEEAFSFINLREQVESGDRMLDDQYNQILQSFTDQGITDEKSILTTLRGFGEGYFRKSLVYLNQLEPDFAVRVGNTAPKGDKSDVDYIKKEKPLDPPEGSVVSHVKFSDLSKEAQEEITKSGEPIQEKYYLIKDSLKMYQTNGEVKFGSFANLGGEALRLTTPGEPHGDYVWDKFMPPEKFAKLSKTEQDLWTKNKKESLKVLESVTKMSKTVRDLIGKDFRTGTLAPGAARDLVSKQITEMLKNSGIKLGKNKDFDKSKFLKDIMKKYEKDGSNEKITAIIDKTLSSLMLKKDLKYDKNGKIDKAKSMPTIIAISALMGSAGMDSTGIEPQSTIHIISTGETHRGNQNDIILQPLLDLMDPKSPCTLSVKVSKISLSCDGSLEFSHQRGGKASGNMYTNTNHFPKSPSSKKTGNI
tara:strand:+ start:18536 stop:20854 length:2319 start_codon:yes stop_codon:yes gene_type:complete